MISFKKLNMKIGALVIIILFGFIRAETQDRYVLDECNRISMTLFEKIILFPMSLTLDEKDFRAERLSACQQGFLESVIWSMIDCCKVIGTHVWEISPSLFNQLFVSQCNLDISLGKNSKQNFSQMSFQIGSFIYSQIERARIKTMDILDAAIHQLSKSRFSTLKLNCQRVKNCLKSSEQQTPIWTKSHKVKPDPVSTSPRHASSPRTLTLLSERIDAKSRNLEGNIDVSGQKNRHHKICASFAKCPCNCGDRQRSKIMMKSKKAPSDSDMSVEEDQLHKVLDPCRMIIDGNSNVYSENNTRTSKEALCSNTGSNELLENQLKQEYSDNVFSGTANGASKSGDEELQVSFENGITASWRNSSFKDDSPYAKNKAGCHAMKMAAGDGIEPVIITKRSPQKEIGVSFDESFNESKFSTTDDPSLLDVSDINKSLAYNTGDGIFEFAVMFAMKSVYTLTKWFVKPKKIPYLDSLDVSTLYDSEQKFEMFMLRPRRRLPFSCKRSIQLSRNTSTNASDLEIIKNEHSELNDTFDNCDDTTDSSRCNSSESQNDLSYVSDLYTHTQIAIDTQDPLHIDITEPSDEPNQS